MEPNFYFYLCFIYFLFFPMLFLLNPRYKRVKLFMSYLSSICKLLELDSELIELSSNSSLSSLLS